MRFLIFKNFHFHLVTFGFCGSALFYRSGGTAVTFEVMELTTTNCEGIFSAQMSFKSKYDMCLGNLKQV